MPAATPAQQLAPLPSLDETQALLRAHIPKREGARANFGALPHQAEGLADETSDTIVFVGGMGSGKTDFVAKKSVLLAVKNHPVIGAVLEPSYPMVRKILLPTYEQLFEERGIPWRYHRGDHLIRFSIGGRWFSIQLATGEKPEHLKGPNLAFALGDEAGILDDEVFRNLPARVRHPQAKVRQVVWAGTPEGMGTFRTWAEGPWDPSRGIRRVIRAKTYDNHHLQPTPQHYVSTKLGHLDAADIDRYVHGLFVPSGQRVYDFHRAQHSLAPGFDPFTGGEILVGCDFNVGKMCWVLGTVTGDALHVWGEVVRYNTTTWDQVEATITQVRDLWDRMYPGPWPHRREDVADMLRLHVDPSAKARNTRAADSDVGVIHRAGVRHVLHYHGIIPIRDRVMSVNWRLRLGKLTVDTAACPNLTESLELQGRDKAGDPEKKAGKSDLSGCADALGYMVFSQPRWRVSSPQGNQVREGSYV